MTDTCCPPHESFSIDCHSNYGRVNPDFNRNRNYNNNNINNNSIYYTQSHFKISNSSQYLHIYQHNSILSMD